MALRGEERERIGKAIAERERTLDKIEEMRKVRLEGFTGHIEFHYNNGVCSRVKKVENV